MSRSNRSCGAAVALRIHRKRRRQRNLEDLVNPAAFHTQSVRQRPTKRQTVALRVFAGPTADFRLPKV